MNLSDTIYQKSLDLPLEKAQQVIDFIDFLKTRTPPSPSTVSLLSAFEEAGLLGCLETDEPLSTTYKTKLNFTAKHGTL